MKPNFALTLSFEGIGLLQRAPGGWLHAGEVSLGSADLAGDLARLSATAVRLAGHEIQCKIVLPNEQIRYLSIDSTGVDDADLAGAVARALDGATPYAVRDLAYDFVRDGPATHIAAVAQETLDEAEGFAVENGFQPVSFVAIPSVGDFAGEPFFGLTRIAGKFLNAGDNLLRDLQPVRIIGTVATAVAETRSLATPADAAPEAAAEAPDSLLPAQAHDPDLQIQDPQDTPPAAPTNSPEGSDAQAPDQPHETVHADSAAQDWTPDAPPGSNETATPDPSVLGNTLRAVDPPEPAAATFASIRARRDAPPPPAAPRPVSATAPIIDIDDAAPLAARVVPGPVAASDAAPAAPQIVAAAGMMAQAGRIGAIFSRRDTSEPAPGARADAIPSKAATTLPAAASERQRMTVFGARKPEKPAVAAPAVTARPRYLGLMMTAVLLLFLLGVAAMAAVYSGETFSRWFSPRDSVPVFAEIDGSDDIDGPDDPVMIEGDETEPEETRTDVARPDPGSIGVATGITSDEFPVALAIPTAPALTPAEIAARYAATGIWQQAPRAPLSPGYSQLDDLYVASIDGSVTETDAVALPAPGTLLGDRPPDMQSSPAAAGTLFAFDPRGLVIATPEGALTPDGVIVYSGRPEVLPAAFPTRFIETPAEVPDQFADLREPRPRARPDDLSQQSERSQLGGLTRNELALLRPRLRPDLPPRIAEPTPEPEEETAAPPVETGTEFAVGESVKPRLRPSGFDRTVAEARAREAEQAKAIAAAVAQARTPPAAQPTVVAPAPRPTNRNSRVQPEEEDEPEIAQASARSVAPRVPSSASVAREATVRNALPLNRMNLIGVYGKPSARSALIRMSNGRYRKVKVGDTLDGGRVSAIGDGELRYTKGGRQITLNMPRG